MSKQWRNQHSNLCFCYWSVWIVCKKKIPNTILFCCLNAFKKIKTIFVYLFFSPCVYNGVPESTLFSLAHCRLSLFTAGWISARPPAHSLSALSLREESTERKREIFIHCAAFAPQSWHCPCNLKVGPWVAGHPLCCAKCIISIRAKAAEFNMMLVSLARVSVCIKWAASSSVCQTHTHSAVSSTHFSRSSFYEMKWERENETPKL